MARKLYYYTIRGTMDRLCEDKEGMQIKGYKKFSFHIVSVNFSFIGILASCPKTCCYSA